MQTRRSREQGALGRTISLRTRVVNQLPSSRLRRHSTKKSDLVKVSKYTLKCGILPTISLSIPSESTASPASSTILPVKKSVKQHSSPTQSNSSATCSKKVVQPISQDQPAANLRSTSSLRYVTRSTSRVNPQCKPVTRNQSTMKEIPPKPRTVTRSMTERNCKRPQRVKKTPQVVINDCNGMEENNSSSDAEVISNPGSCVSTASSTHSAQRNVRKRTNPLSTLPFFSHKLRQIRRSQCFRNVSARTRRQLSSTVPTSPSTRPSNKKFTRSRQVRVSQRQQSSKSADEVERSYESGFSPLMKRPRRLSPVSSVSSYSEYSSSIASSKSTIACVQNHPLTSRRSRRLRSCRRVAPIFPRCGSHRSQLTATALPKASSPTSAEDNKENRTYPALVYNNHNSSVFKAPHMITRHASHVSKAATHPPSLPITPVMNGKTLPHDSKLASTARAVLTPSQLSVSGSIASSVRSLTNSIKSPEKLQGERLKKLKSRYIELDTDGATETASQISALSPSVASILNGTEQDAYERLLDLLEQNSAKAWSDVFNLHEDLSKIGEGVYGEVFQINGSTGDVIKVFPIEGDLSIMDGSRAQMTFHSVYPEVYVSKRLTELAKKSRDNRTVCFSQMKRASLVKGKLPEPFVIQWRVYDALYSSENICLDHLPDSQLWIILEYEYAGVTLDKYKFTSYLEARSVFEQLSLSLAAAEAELQFEHRDLHWGNVLIRPTRLDKLRFRVNGVNYSVWTYGVRATIIDFTVSRMGYRGNTVYVDMSENPDIFSVYDGEYQNEIYRMMRSLNGNDWRGFKPKTNLMWLHYLCHKLLHEVKICARGDTHFEAIYSELVALEEELRQVVQPPDNVLRSRGPTCSTTAHAKGGGTSQHAVNGRAHTKAGHGHVHNLQVPQYVGAADFVSKNFYFDSCRMNSGSAL